MTFDPNNFNLQKMMEEAQKLQEQMKGLQENLTQMRASYEAGGGLVKATMTPTGLAELVIHKTIMEEGEKVVAELVMSAINGAMKKLEEMSKKQIAALTAGIQLPPELTGAMKDQGEEGGGTKAG